MRVVMQSRRGRELECRMLHSSAGRGEEEGERERKRGEQFEIVSPLMAPCCAPTGHLARPLLKLTAPGRKGWELM